MFVFMDAMEESMPTGSREVAWATYDQGWAGSEGEVIGEAIITINVNGDELISLMATPAQQTELGLGFLLNEGLIKGSQDLDHVHLSEDGCCVDIWLKHAIEIPDRRIITSGCGGGATFEDTNVAVEKISEDMTISPGNLFSLFRKLHFPDSLHARARGVHASGLTDGEDILALAEDVGRHNSIDKITGICLINDIPTEGTALLATGRISSEMLRKAARMGCPIVASRNSPTSLSVEMAQATGITLVGYARQGKLRAYTHAYRLGFEEDPSG
jgi:FdhD protein